MRATTLPLGILWTLFESLPPLAATSAKEVFLTINATFCNGSDDGNEVLDELLRALNYCTLPTKQRTRMLSLDSNTQDKLESVEVSVSLSMESLDVERNHKAIQLLGMLCLLPDGLLRWQDRLQTLEVIETTFETATSDLFSLRLGAAQCSSRLGRNSCNAEELF
ncbi:hypothetical protein FIBSPDRAFT_947188 [Athelia psychrophila]|uniref:Uncharacterized protein n=1 Tax=Athelia psychrophila TaxID=1759441 RepID=A0A166S9R6_9AGAM|nr:hypothetical protein FIBSPDRAFT_947188 [Fibularhizoctonia sp. CBS 109695]